MRFTSYELKSYQVQDRSRFAKDKDYDKKPRVYVYEAGETIMENVIHRRFRPVQEYKVIVAQVLAELGILEDDVELKWNVKAGCSLCACSPGFVLTFNSRSDFRLKHQDIYITVIKDGELYDVCEETEQYVYFCECDKCENIVKVKKAEYVKNNK